MSLVEIGSVLAQPTDFIRLLAIPLFAIIAWRDHKTRRIPNKVWPPLIIVSIGLLSWDLWNAWGTVNFRFIVAPLLISIFLIIPGAYVAFVIGGFGGADAKALMVLALLFPVYPEYYIGDFAVTLPMQNTVVGNFAFAIFTNTVIVALFIPVYFTVRNTLRGNIAKIMYLGKEKPVKKTPSIPGQLLETPDGLVHRGLDLDVLRMYLQWRGATLTAIKSDPQAFRHPSTLPEARNDPGDGAAINYSEERSDSQSSVSPTTSEKKTVDTLPDGGGEETENSEKQDVDIDWWCAEKFFEEADYTYGETPETLRQGLETLIEKDSVWVSPGTPFFIPMTIGIVMAFIFGNIMFILL